MLQTQIPQSFKYQLVKMLTTGFRYFLIYSELDMINFLLNFYKRKVAIFIFSDQIQNSIIILYNVCIGTHI